MSRRRTLLITENVLSVNEEDVVDDDVEKRDRHSTVDPLTRSSRRKSIAPLGNNNEQNKSRVNAPSTPVVVIPKPNNEQLSCLYNNCIKLLNENKINQKNAFQLKLIDYLSDIVTNEGIIGRDTNFQVVGCTIDAGSKIYAARVDALHQNTYQMLSGLGHNQDGTNNDDNNTNTDGVMNNDGLDGDDEANKRKDNKKKRRVKKSSQIVENLDQITAKINEDCLLDDDLYFSRISTSIEQEAIEGLLMNKLKYKNDSLNLLINKDDVYFDIDEIEQERNQAQLNVNIKNLCEYASKCELQNSKICDEMSKFRFIGWNLETNDDITRLCENLNEDLEKDRFDRSSNMIDLHEKQQQQQQQLQQQLDNSNFDAVGFDDVNEHMDIDHDIDGVGPVGGDASVPTLNEPPANIEQFDDIRSHKSIADMTTLLQHSMNIQSEYSYFNFDKLKLHDLPRHLKVFALKLTNQQQTMSGQQQDQQNLQIQQQNLKDRRKKEAPKLDLSILLDRSKFFKITKKAIFLSDRTIEKRFDKTYNLETERELDYNARELLQPYCKEINAKLFTSELEDIDNLLIDNNNKLNQTVVGNNQTIIGVGNANGDQFAANNDDYDDGPMMDADGCVGGDGGGIDGNFDIPNTIPPTQEFFTQNGGEFNFETQLPTNPFNGNNIVLDGDNLVQAPEQVNALYIEYAKKAKNIDAKKLKQVIWGLICMSNNDKQENINEQANDQELNKSNNSTINCKLSDIYKQLKPPLISQRTFDDLSVSIVFQMLLFLANEHGLRLNNTEDGTDIFITKVIVEVASF